MSMERDVDALTLGFEQRCVIVPIASLVPLKRLREHSLKTKKYKQIVASIRAIGIVEPPAICPDTNTPGSYFLLDGNLRIEALKELGVAEVECLLARDDETYTYNKRISRLNAAQDHRMIVRAVEQGVPEERIAEALGLDVNTVRKRFHMLTGICDEAKRLLDDKPCPMKVFDIFKCMAPLRQIEAAELMVGHGNYTVLFANAMLAATPEDQLVKKTSRRTDGAVREVIARQERELSLLQVHIKTIEGNLGDDVLLLTVTKGYLKKMLGNAKIVRWFAQRHPEYLQEFQAIAEMESIPGAR